MKKEALLYEKLDNKMVHCFLCGHQCRIADGKAGFCGVRKNEAGTLFSLVYRNAISTNVDPIEKKPLYHFLPGTNSFSIATAGCNFRCGFCQNWEISQMNILEVPDYISRDLGPEAVVSGAIRKNCQSISYTYTEPTIYFEYAYDCAKIAREKGLKNVFVTNGYMSKEALQAIQPYLDAANVDLKYFKDESYRKVCSGSLQPVLDSIKLMKKLGIWVEVTTLVVPGSNDSPEELKGIAEFLAGVDKFMPWHISRFFPNYKMTELDATPEETLKKAEEIGRKAGLKYVYVGNVHGWGNDTHCHNCKKLLIKREGFDILENNVKEGKCAFCSTAIPGRFS
ncbi:MAG: AmmeMemoRadiSam system radical SAM enzyme [Candidatus Omnitrophica bacterium]|nr:AmmeMemoRadiSam system radical SAM enzyme [Candidatus Omnitrophota bacterium]